MTTIKIPFERFPLEDSEAYILFEILAWCEGNINGSKHDIEDKVHLFTFPKEQDALLFALRWL